MSLIRTVTIVGQGYVGLPVALAAASAGWKVYGLEINSDRMKALRSGISLVEDVSNATLQELIQNGKYVPTSDPMVISQSSIAVLCVPTPLDDTHQPDLSYLESAAQMVGENVRPGCLVINESTSHPGTLRNLILPIIQSAINFEIESLDFASSPERIDPGNVKWNLNSTPRIVAGLTDRAEARAKSFYETFCSHVVVASTPEVAEMAKMLENTFRLINIGFINELSSLMTDFNLDMREVVKVASTKPYGFMPFFPSAGIGGHCIPVDPYYLDRSLKDQGVASRILESALKANEERPRFIFDKAIQLRPNSKRILLLGVAYKAGIGDSRESAAEKIAHEAKKKNMEVYWHDPLVKEWQHGSPWLQQEVDVAIYLVDQPGQAELVQGLNCMIIDCTGKLQGFPSLTQL
jgi:UDP-N-acetyl-D-glucosamine dehydrogenase